MSAISRVLFGSVLLVGCSASGGSPPSVDLEVTPLSVQDTLKVPQVVSIPLQRLCDSLSIPRDSISFLVRKAERRFVVVGKGRELKVFPCVLGENPVGDKFHQGDRRTPEGVFGFRGKRVHTQWHKFIWIDYPNAESRRRYRERTAQGLIPAGRDIGGEIGIHGVPDGLDHWIDSGVDWTWGCIALRNADVDEIYPFIRVGTTTITIVP